MIDVIIPAYNSHKTIDKTLMSLCIQRLAKYLHVLIVDDGSEEPYDYLIQRFSEYLGSLKIIRVDQNKGVGYCRQLALRSTRQPWIYFLDSDDYMVSSFAFNRLYEATLMSKNTKMVFATIQQELYPCTNLGTRLETDVFRDPNGNMLYLHGKLYNRAGIMDNGITFPNTRSNEDIAFNLECFTLFKEDEIAKITSTVAETICNTSSITRSTTSTRVYKLNNCNENMDAYVAMMHANKNVRRRLQENVNSKTCRYLIEKYADIFMKGIMADFDDPDEQKLYQYINLVYYRDIVKPILTANGTNKKIDERYVNASNFNHWGEAWYSLPRPDINVWSETHLKEFDEDEFKRLCDKYLTGDGYIG